VPVGFTVNTGVSATSRGALQALAGQVLFRFDAEDYRCWGDSNGTTNTVTGIQYNMQDQLDSTAEQYTVRLYGEDVTTLTPTSTNFAGTSPPGTNQLVSFGPFSTPVGPGIIQAWQFTLTFTTPLALPDGQDVFMGFDLAAAPAWTADGLSIWIEFGLQQPNPPFSVWDLKGPGAISGGVTSNSYSLVHDPAAGTLAYGGQRQGIVDFLTTSTVGRGVATAQTNQTSLPTSNAPPGTASFFSGLHPDAATPPLNGGPADTPSYVFPSPPTRPI